MVGVLVAGWRWESLVLWQLRGKSCSSALWYGTLKLCSAFQRALVWKYDGKGEYCHWWIYGSYYDTATCIDVFQWKVGESSNVLCFVDPSLKGCPACLCAVSIPLKDGVGQYALNWAVIKSLQQRGRDVTLPQCPEDMQSLLGLLYCKPWGLYSTLSRCWCESLGTWSWLPGPPLNLLSWVAGVHSVSA